MTVDMDREARDLADILAKGGWKHVRVTKRGSALTVVSGPEDDPDPEFRLTRAGRDGWRLDLPTHRGRWEQTPFVGDIAAMVDAAASVGRLEDTDAAPWNRGDTSDPSH